MARTNTYYDPSVKLFESYTSFAGGLNSEISEENLRDHEFPVLENVELSSRGSAKRRTGRVKPFANTPAGTLQGMFHYYRFGQATPDFVFAIGGKLYVTADFLPVEIRDPGVFTFQSTLTVEAVQHKDKLYVATGTKLVQLGCDDVTGVWSAQVVTPYTPTPLEAIRVGTNGLAANPSLYIQDGVNDLEVTAIVPSRRSGSEHESITMTAFINKPSAVTSLDYMWEYRRSVDTTWNSLSDYTTNDKDVIFKMNIAGNYDIRCTIRQTGTTTPEANYILPGYIVTSIPEKWNDDLPITGINACRKILLHWDRIILAGDNTHAHQIYISDNNNPAYFPVTNTINFDFGKREPITAIVRHQDILVFFTNTTIQTLTGKSTEDYRRNLIHDGIGCIAGKTAHVTGNFIVFLSNDGLYRLKPNYYNLETMNVAKIDYPIKTQIARDKDACAMVYDGQYWLCFPDRKVLYRFYYDSGVWAKDVSNKLDITEFAQFGNDIYNLTTSGAIYKHSDIVHSDDGEVYTMRIDTRYLDLSSPFNRKKLRNLYVIYGKAALSKVEFRLTVYADSQQILSPIAGHAEIINGSTTWITTDEPNDKFYGGTSFGNWIMGVSPLGGNQLNFTKHNISGKCRRVKVVFEHDQDCDVEVLGFGIRFKLKKV